MGRVVYENYVRLRGVVGDNVIWGLAVNNRKYCSFQIITNNDGKYISEMETNSKEYLRVIVFNRRRVKLVDKMERYGFKRGMYVGVEGRLQTSKTEFKGNSIIQLMIYVKKIWIIDKDGSETVIE